MKILIRFVSGVCILLSLLLVPEVLLAQDADGATEEEILRHRNALIEAGYLQERADLPTLAASAEATLSNVHYMNKSRAVETRGTRSTDFRPNGTRIYIVGRDTRNVVEYHLSDPWDISTASYRREMDFSSELGSAAQPNLAAHGIYIDKNSGETMWIFNRTEIWEYTLSSAWNVSSATPSGYRDFSDDHILRGHDIDFKPDGRVLYIDDRELGVVFQYELSTPWDVSTADLDYVYDISSFQESVRGTQFSPDGRKMFMSDSGTRQLYEFHLSSPYELRTASHTGSYTFGSEIEGTLQVTFSTDFDRFYMTSSDEIHQYQFSLPPDKQLSTISTSTTRVQANNQNSSRITVTVRDENGDRLEGFLTRLSSVSGNVQSSPSTAVSNADGEARFDVTNSQVEQVTYGAVTGDVTIQGTAQVRFIGIDAGLSEISVSDSQVEADGSDHAEITITARDEDGEPFSNLQMQLQADGGSSNIEAVQRRTNSDGIAVFRVSSQIPERVTYSARGLGTTIDNTVTVTFVPAAPVVLSPTDVETRSLRANWEIVQGADEYRLDVATDEEFSNFLSGYNDRNVGHTTDYNIDGLQPGTTYYYRVRATAGDLIGANSDVVEVTTFPETPVASVATNRNALFFTANWEPAEGARNYRLDVAEDSEFSQIISEYEDLDVGDQTSQRVEGLEPGSNYYYRVRSEAGPRVSNNSNSISAATLSISAQRSQIEKEQLRILANGVQTNQITIRLMNEEDILLEGLRVTLTPDGGQSQIEPVQEQTDEEGVALFDLSNLQGETVSYSVEAHGTEIGTFDVEYLEDRGELVLGDNYPNPFQVRTTLPVQVPRAMNVELRVYDLLGRPVQTVLQERLEAGYYEIPFSAAGLAAGAYFYRLFADNEVITKRMVMVH